MSWLVEIDVRGVSDAGPFEGGFSFAQGLQIVSAKNHFGKSLVVKSIAWCLGLERMFGLQDDDPACFPVAVRDVVDFDNARSVPVRSSAATLTLAREDGARIKLRREIKGNPVEVVVDEFSPTQELLRTSRLYARRQTMKDEHAGLQRFLFGWLNLPRKPVMTIRGEPGEVYLENIAPLFYIDQSEGWTDLQAQQVYRYGLQQISSIAVEYLLGALDAVDARFTQQTIVAREAKLKAEASGLASQVAALFGKQGWIYNWSAHGSVSDIGKRWAARTLFDIARGEFHFDPDKELTDLRRRADALREVLGRGKLDPVDTSAASNASQAVIDLKTRSHSLRQELRTARIQQQEQRQLADSLEHRVHSAKDILRLKREGIGRLDSIECPTCHRSLDPSTFALTAQSTISVEAHIDALERDRVLVIANLQSTDAQTTRVAAELSRVEEQFRAAERALSSVNAAVGSVREQLAKAATDLASVEYQIEKTTTLTRDIEGLQAAIEAWLHESIELAAPQRVAVDLAHRRSVFEAELRILLRALGHKAVTAESERDLRLDEDYVPYLASRRLRSLGSASDHPRLVAAYALALAEASRTLSGLHPGFVILDEPLQQNPDAEHRELFVRFLQSAAAKQLRYQTLVFTWLQDQERLRLEQAGVRVIAPEGEHLLRLAAIGEGNKAG